MARRLSISTLTLAICFGLSAAPTRAQTDFSKFPLAKAVPADVFLAVMAKGNPERKFLDDHWQRVWKSLHESGIASDVWEMISDAMSDEQAEKVDQLSEQFTTLCSAVDWSALFNREMVHAGRYVLPVGGLPYEGLLLGRADKEKSAANFKALKAILDAVVALAESHGGKGEITVTESEKDGFTMAVLAPAAAPGVGLAVGYWKDVTVIGFGGLGLMHDSVALLQGKKDVKNLLSSERFKNAFAKLPPAEDEVFFFDLNNMLGQLRQMVGTMTQAKAGHAQKAKAAAKSRHDSDADSDDDEPAAKADSKKSKAAVKAKGPKKKPAADDDEEAGDESGDDEEDEGPDDDAAVLAMIPKVFDEISFMDYIASVEWTEEFHVHKETLAALRPEAKGRVLYDAFTTGKPVTNYERLIPKEAKEFSVSSGMNWSHLYHGVRDFYSENFPRGKKNLAKFDRMQKDQWNLDIDADILSLLGGGHVSVNMGKDTVFMVKVSDQEKADALLKRLFDHVSEHFGKEGGLVITDTEVAGHAGFRQITHPMMMMMGGLSPICGCAEGYFMIGTSAKAVRVCLETAAGKHANITKSEQFIAQGAMPKSGAVRNICFVDQSNMAEEIQAVVGGFSMALGMMGMMAQDMPPEARALVTKIPPILAKLGPVAGKLDFFVSKGEYTTLENGVWRTHEVQNYKGPRPPEEETDDKAADEDAKPKKKAPAAPKKKPAKPHKDEDDDDGDE